MFHIDDVGTEVTEQGSDERPGEYRGGLHDPNSVERAGRESSLRLVCTSRIPFRWRPIDFGTMHT